VSVNPAAGHQELFAVAGRAVHPIVVHQQGKEKMGLVACSECKNEISDKALSCPKCGHPASREPSSVTPAESSAGFSELKFGDRAAMPRKRVGKVAVASLLLGVPLICTALYVLNPPMIADLFSSTGRLPSSATDASDSSATVPEAVPNEIDSKSEELGGDVAIQGANGDAAADKFSPLYGTWCGVAKLEPDGRAKQPDKMHVKFEISEDRYAFHSLFVDNVHGPVNGWSRTQDCKAPSYEKTGNMTKLLANCQATGLLLDTSSGDMTFMFGEELEGSASSDCTTSDSLASLARTDEEIERSVEAATPRLSYCAQQGAKLFALRTDAPPYCAQLVSAVRSTFEDGLCKSLTSTGISEDDPAYSAVEATLREQTRNLRAQLPNGCI